MIERGGGLPINAALPTRNRVVAVGPEECCVESLDNIILHRRSVREYLEQPMPRGVLEKIMRAAHNALLIRARRGGPPCFVRPVLGVAKMSCELPTGLYELENNELKLRAGFDQERLRDCVSQAALGEAAALVVGVGDLGVALAERGERGYRELAQYSGVAIGAASLTAAAHGMGGCIAGGIIPAGLDGSAGMNGFNDCPLLGCTLGAPRR
jgi:nitroreductase